MKRRLFNFVCAGSLLVSIITAGVWLRSIWVGDVFEFAARPIPPPAGPRPPPKSSSWSRQLSIRSGRGALQVHWASRWRDDSDQRTAPHSGYKTTPPAFAILRHPPIPEAIDDAWSFAGVQHFDRPRAIKRYGGGLSIVPGLSYLTIPYWSVVFIGALPALVRTARRFTRAGRFLPGHCVACGYDLRATPERCPECGTEAKPRRTAGATA